MLNIYRFAEKRNHQVEGQGVESLVVELPFEQRKRSRIRAETTCGVVVGLFLERGTVLRNDDLLQAESGELVRISAAIEHVTTVTAPDQLVLLKAAYHLGNRHVPLQVDIADKGIHRLRYLEDYVLDDMVVQLGANIVHEHAPFHPESGAYGSNGKVAGGHHHDHDEQHGHQHEHQHQHEHRHD
jgi:urease accessory protein